jgi:hypothetical protein
MKRWLKLEKKFYNTYLNNIGYYLGLKYYPSCHVHFENIHGLLITWIEPVDFQKNNNQVIEYILFGNLSGFSFPFFFIDKYH